MNNFQFQGAFCLICYFRSGLVPKAPLYLANILLNGLYDLLVFEDPTVI